MKKLLTLSVLLILLSCEKLQDDYCWKCTTFYYERWYADWGDVFEKREVDSTEVCGMTERDASKYEKYHTMPHHIISTCGDRIRWQDCYCVKMEE